MNKTMRPVSVSTKDGLIHIAQDGEKIVAITPEQAPLLMQWIQEGVRSLGNDPVASAQTDAETALHEFENPASS